MLWFCRPYNGKWPLVGSKEVKPLRDLIDMTIQHPDDFRLWKGAWITQVHTAADSKVFGIESLYLYEHKEAI